MWKTYFIFDATRKYTSVVFDKRFSTDLLAHRKKKTYVRLVYVSICLVQERTRTNTHEWNRFTAHNAVANEQQSKKSVKWEKPSSTAIADWCWRAFERAEHKFVQWTQCFPTSSAVIGSAKGISANQRSIQPWNFSTSLFWNSLGGTMPYVPSVCNFVNLIFPS